MKTIKGQIKILNLNIFRGYHTQFHNTYKWENRRDILINFIKEQSPDIILFQECNKLQMSENMEFFMNSIPEYNYSIYYSHPNIYRSKALIIAYNPLKVFKISEVTKWLSDTPDIPSDTWTKSPENFGRIVVGNKFVKVEGNNISKDFFWIFNTHFDVNYCHIVNSIKLLPRLLSEIINDKNANVIVAGDFNTDLNSLFKEFSRYGFLCLSENLKSNDNKELKFTFVGKRDKGLLDDNELLYLDHVFGRNVTKYNVYCPLDYQFILNEYMMSDHLPIMIVANF